MFPQFCRFLIVSFVVTSAASCGAVKSRYNVKAMKEREAVLRDQLFQMRTIIDQYSADQGRLPQSLKDLVDGGYLRQIPEDPITQKPDWKLIMGEDPNSKGRVGIVDIRSSSSEKSTEGKPYNDW